MTAALAIELVLNTVSGLREEGDSVSKYFLHPEIKSNIIAMPLTPSVGYSAYPKSKKILFGLNVTF